MSYFFDVYGPYEIDRHEREIRRAGQSMWDHAEEQAEGLARAWGCYMFCIDNGQSAMRYYVGKTTAQGGFRDEVFADHKLRLFNDISEYKGKRSMLLFPLLTGDEGHFSKNASSKPVVEWLERMLIGLALDRNVDLLNLRDTKLLRSVTVRGVIGEKAKGRPYQEVQYARRALGIG
jgi:hypothetical protein